MSLSEIKKKSSAPKPDVKDLSKATRSWRRIHHYLGLGIAVLLLLSALTGLLLGWKKDVGLLQPPTRQGAAAELTEWLPLHRLESAAGKALHDRQPGNFSVDRIDVRPDKGIAKVLFIPGYWEVQVDGATAEILSVEKRYSDLIEQIHDGSIISDGFKLVSMNVLGAGILALIFSGLWLWYGPWKIRRLKRSEKGV